MRLGEEEPRPLGSTLSSSPQGGGWLEPEQGHPLTNAVLGHSLESGPGHLTCVSQRSGSGQGGEKWGLPEGNRELSRKESWERPRQIRAWGWGRGWEAGWVGCALWTRWVRPAEGWERCGYWKGRPFGKHGILIGMAKGISLTWRGHLGRGPPARGFLWGQGAVGVGEQWWLVRTWVWARWELTAEKGLGAGPLAVVRGDAKDKEFQGPCPCTAPPICGLSLHPSCCPLPSLPPGFC